MGHNGIRPPQRLGTSWDGTLRVRRVHDQRGEDVQDVCHPFAAAVAHDRGVEAEHLLGTVGYRQGLGENMPG